MDPTAPRDFRPTGTPGPAATNHPDAPATPPTHPAPITPAGLTPAGPTPAETAGQQRLFAPWRLEYLQSLDAGGSGGGAQPGHAAPAGSFLSRAWTQTGSEDRNLVILRTADTPPGTGGMIMLNRYPYSNGHLLVALGQPRPTLLDYDPHQRAALWALVDRAAALMQQALQPQGINIGVNQGRAAGAGVPDHLHVHLVPRWSGDVNFTTTVANTRVIPASLEAMLARYRAAVSEGLPPN